MSQEDEFSDENVPEEFCDPITLALMVTLSYVDLRGRIYSRLRPL